MKALSRRLRRGKIKKFTLTTRVHVEAERSINSAADGSSRDRENQEQRIERGDRVVELDQFKTRLTAYESPLAEVRDSL